MRISSPKWGSCWTVSTTFTAKLQLVWVLTQEYKLCVLFWAANRKQLLYFSLDYRGEVQELTFDQPQVRKLFYGSFHKVKTCTHTEMCTYYSCSINCFFFFLFQCISIWLPVASCSGPPVSQPGGRLPLCGLPACGRKASPPSRNLAHRGLRDAGQTGEDPRTQQRFCIGSLSAVAPIQLYGYTRLKPSLLSYVATHSSPSSPLRLSAIPRGLYRTPAATFLEWSVCPYLHWAACCACCLLAKSQNRTGRYCTDRCCFSFFLLMDLLSSMGIIQNVKRNVLLVELKLPYDQAAPWWTFCSHPWNGRKI